MSFLSKGIQLKTVGTKGGTYRCHCHLIDKEVGEPSSLADESFLTEQEGTGSPRLVIRIRFHNHLSLQGQDAAGWRQMIKEI